MDKIKEMKDSQNFETRLREVIQGPKKAKGDKINGEENKKEDREQQIENKEDIETAEARAQTIKAVFTEVLDKKDPQWNYAQFDWINNERVNWKKLTKFDSRELEHQTYSSYRRGVPPIRWEEVIDVHNVQEQSSGLEFRQENGQAQEAQQEEQEAKEVEQEEDSKGLEQEEEAKEGEKEEGTKETKQKEETSDIKQVEQIKQPKPEDNMPLNPQKEETQEEEEETIIEHEKQEITQDHESQQPIQDHEHSSKEITHQNAKPHLPLQAPQPTPKPRDLTEKEESISLRKQARQALERSMKSWFR